MAILLFTLFIKYNGTKGVRSGYRVIGMGMMTPSDPSVQHFDPRRHGAHDASQLVMDEVGDWRPPEGFRTADAIQAGERLWMETDLLRDIDGTDIQASCGSSRR